eukprot:scaffold90856_cov36-Cyclotella_meneghiniana.AAC.1
MTPLRAADCGDFSRGPRLERSLHSNSFVVSTIFFTRSCSDFMPKRSWRTLEGHEVKSDLKFRDLRLDMLPSLQGKH